MRRLAIGSLALLCALMTTGASAASAQDAPPAGTPTAEPTTTEEAQRAQLAAHDQATAATAAREGTTTEDESESESESEDDGERHAQGDATLSASVFPPPPPPEPEEPDPELEEGLVLPPPEPEWRLRVGVGASASTSGGPPVSLRLTEELEWMPLAAAPILFALTGGEVVNGEFVLGLAGARIGLYGLFCQDRVVTCMGAVALRAGAIVGNNSVGFDIGGDGDARFRFDGVELGVRVGFFVLQGATFVDLVGLVGAAF